MLNMMMRDQNPGLARRFQPQNMVEFEDFGDRELLKVFVALCRKQHVYAPLEVKLRAVKMLAQQRTLPNFGNVGAVVNLVADAKQRMALRLGDEALEAGEQELQLSDVDVDGEQADPEQALATLAGYGEI